MGCGESLNPNRLLTPVPMQFNKEMDELFSAQGRKSFETQTGFTVVGTEVKAVYVDGRRSGSNLFTEEGAQQIRVLSKRLSRSVVIEFADGCGTCMECSQVISVRW